MITTYVPSDWHDLQTHVARILSECGFSTEIEKVVEGVRGGVEIDVFAEEQVKGRTYVIACECKHWQARVPQSVIHGFRTVVGDTGANLGYIISMEGFQSGSFTASELTNIRLLTWDEFQVEFEQSWLSSYFSPEMARRLDPLITYVEPLPPRWLDKLSEPDLAEFRELRDRYQMFGMGMMVFMPYLRVLHVTPFPGLPLGNRTPEEFRNGIPDAVLNAQGYRELLDAVTEYANEAIARFRTIRDRANLPEIPPYT